MIAYFDTSAFIPLFVDEPGSEVAGALWDEADHRVSVRLVYPEARAALAQAQRIGRVDSGQLRRLVEEVDLHYQQLDRVGIDEALAQRAGTLAELFGLRGYDAVHLAGAERLADEQAVFVSGDLRLCLAAAELGMAVANTQ